VLPGVGPIATIAMLLPITFGFDPTGALIMLAGIYYGAQYGGSTTAILVNIPVKRPLLSPCSMVTRWPSRVALVWRWAWQLWARSLRALWRRSSLQRSASH